MSLSADVKAFSSPSVWSGLTLHTFQFAESLYQSCVSIFSVLQCLGPLLTTYRIAFDQFKANYLGAAQNEAAYSKVASNQLICHLRLYDVVR